MRRAQRCDHVAGFTLVEALVAMLLMGMVMASLATITAQWLPNWNRGFARVQSAEHLSLVLDRLAGDLAAAEFVTLNRNNPRPLFEGAELGVTLCAIGNRPQCPRRPRRRADRRDGRSLGTGSGASAHTVRAGGKGGEAIHRPGRAAARALSHHIVLCRRGPRLEGTWSGARELPSAVRFTIRDGGERPHAVGLDRHGYSHPTARALRELG